MNSGRICIPACAETRDKLYRRIEEAALSADAVEVRFDCLENGQFDGTAAGLPKIDTLYIFTLRPQDQGGRNASSLGDRQRFWSSVLHANIGHEFLIDREYDLELPFQFDPRRTIVSYHNFDSADISPEIAAKLLASPAGNILKVAVTAADVCDAIPLWRFFGDARAGGREVVPIAMGEAGKWTRILALARGAFMTFGSLRSGGTAPGQVVADEMHDLYRVGELDETTGIYGIIAGDTSYSVSPYLHNAAFASRRMNSVFVPLQTSDPGNFLKRMVRRATREIDLEFRGFSVTNPHKQAVIPHLDEIDETARVIGAVNTVKLEGVRLVGYNTDAEGFIKPLLTRYPDLRDAHVAVVGAGGAARACIFSLKRESANVSLFARDTAKATVMAAEFGCSLRQLTPEARFSDFDIVVNTTPLGTRGSHENGTAAVAGQLSGVGLVYDLVYNPSETKLIKEAREAGAKTLGGLEMLIAQGARQFEIWTGFEAPTEAMEAAVRKRLGI